MTPYILTNSEITSFQHCPRCWYLGYYRCLKRAEAKSTLTIGSLYHAAMEGYYGGKHEPLEFVKTKAVYMIEQNPAQATAIAKDAEMVGIMVDGYLEWLAVEGADADLDVIAAEEMIEVELTGELRLRGKLDARAVRRSSGIRVFLEHKTCQNFVDLPKLAQTNPQFLSYSLLEYLDILHSGSEGAERTDGVLLNMARKVKRTPRATPPFYAREEVRYNLNELRNHWRHTVTVGEAILATRAKLDAGMPLANVCPPTSTRECSWKCGFSQLCLSGIMDDGSDWEGFVADQYVVVDPLQRYEEEVLNGAD